MKVFALIPAYQAADTIKEVVAGCIARFPDEPRVLVVDDGSSDATGSLAKEAGALVIRHQRNRGKGVALRTGLAWAHRLGARCVVSLDADGQHPAEEALSLGQHPAAPSSLVLGVRDLLAAGAPRPNQLSNRLSNFFLSGFGGQELADTHCGLRRYPVAETLALGAWSDGFAYEAEVVLRAARAGWVIAQVPVQVSYPHASARGSHFHQLRDPIRIVSTVLLTLATTVRH